MSEPNHKPHDKLFKLTVGDVRVARDLFIAHLPEKLLSQIDLCSLEMQNVTFIKNDFVLLESDMLYKAKLKNNDVFIYTLCEHQSESDREMPLRMWKYMMSIIDYFKKQYENKSFPVIYPMVVYTGEKKYSYSMDFFDLFAQPELAREFWQNPIQLINVSNESDEMIKQHQWFGIVKLIFKYRNSNKFEEFLNSFLPWLKELKPKINDDLIRILIHYVLTEYKEVNYDLFTTKIEQCLSKTDEDENMVRRAGMTIADELYELGLEKGIEQGKQLGMQQGQSKLLWNLLESKFKHIPSHIHQLVFSADADTLLHWSECLIEAKNLEEIFEPVNTF